MSTIKVEVEVSKETHEACAGIVAMLVAVKEAKKDGWQAGQDLPKIAMVAFGQMAAIEGVDLIDDEMREDPVAFARALALGISDGVSALRKKDVPA